MKKSFWQKQLNKFKIRKNKKLREANPMKILTMGSPASTYIFNQEVNEVYNGNYEVETVKEFYTLGHLLSNYNNVKQYAETIDQDEELFEFLNWNYEEKFWKKLESFQPDFLVLDLFPEIYFGSFVLEDGTTITRNFRLMDSIPEGAIPFNTKQIDYIPKVLEQAEKFAQRVYELSPNTKLLFNGARFPKQMSKNGEIKEKYYRSKYKFSDGKIDGYNRNWEELDQGLIGKGFTVLKFDQQNSAAELNFPTGDHWYYLYNQNYYTDVQTQIEMVAQQYNLGPTILTLDLEQKIDYKKIHEDIVFLNVPNAKNDLSVFRKNKKARKIELTLAKMDYVPHGNRGSSYRFIKRDQLKTKFPKFKDVHYRIIPPKDKKNYWENKLLVRMFSFNTHYNTSMFKRNFQSDFATLKDSVTKNTYILEIGDINLVDGSYYSNTKNYPTYENEIQELIDFIAKKYEVDHNDIVLYGASRGGAGAMLHASLGNYKFVATDTVINDMPWYVDSDSHFIKGLRDVDLTEKMKSALNNYQRPKTDGVLLTTNNVGVTFSSHLRLPLEKFTLLNLDFNLYDHGLFNGKTVPIQLSYINYLLIKNSLHVIESNNDLPEDGVVFEIKHLAKEAINFEKINCFRIRLADIEKDNGSKYDKAMKNIQGKYKRVKVDQEFEYFESI